MCNHRLMRISVSVKTNIETIKEISAQVAKW